MRIIKLIAFIAVIWFAMAACKGPVTPYQSPDLPETGSISGKAFFKNSNNHAGIVVTLEKTDGLQSMAARSVAAGVTTIPDGSYAFAGVEPGTYTIYASSPDSRERAVAVNNVTLGAGKSVTAADLMLTATGSINGQITIDNKSNNNSGFLVSIAGTSYAAVTDDDGYFVISDVPAGSGYLIIVIKGNYTTTWTGATVTVNAGDALTLSPRRMNITSAQMGNNGIIWHGELASHPVSPVLNWAYFNTTDKTSYIWNGSKWDVLAAPGGNGNTPFVGENGNWWIGGSDTGKPAQGSSGAPGSIVTIQNGSWHIDGVDTGVSVYGHPGTVVTIADGYWFIDGVTTGIPVQGAQGEPGAPGIDGADGRAGSIVTIQNGTWHIDGVDTGVSVYGTKGDTGAVGSAGTDGRDGTVVTIVEGYWYLDGVSTGIPVQGAQGEPGAPGINGADGRAGSVVTIQNGTWHIDGVDTGVSVYGTKGDTGAVGSAGTDGRDGTVVTIVEGYWYLDGISTGIPVQGAQGEPGAPGTDGMAGSIVTIQNGTWHIDGVDTGVSVYGTKGDTGAVGSAGTDGRDGTVVTIVEGYWYLDGVSTGIPVQGAQGEPGAPGIDGADGRAGSIVTIQNGTWHIDGVDTGVSVYGTKGDTGAVGSAGTDGRDGTVVTIVEGYWYLDGVSTGIPVQGAQGEPGVPGANGEAGSVVTIKNGNWYIDNVDTGVPATGPQGPAGSDGFIPVTGINLNSENQYTMIKNSKGILSATVVPGNATIKTVFWSSSNTNVAAINTLTGEITAVTSGTATITAVAADSTLGNFVATCEVTILEGQTIISFDDFEDISAEISAPAIHLIAGTGKPASLTITLGNASQYNAGSIKWYYSRMVINTGISGTRGETLTVTSSTYNRIGLYAITVEVKKDGKLYSKIINFEVKP